MVINFVFTSGKNLAINVYTFTKSYFKLYSYTWHMREDWRAEKIVQLQKYTCSFSLSSAAELDRKTYSNACNWNNMYHIRSRPYVWLPQYVCMYKIKWTIVCLFYGRHFSYCFFFFLCTMQVKSTIKMN